MFCCVFYLERPFVSKEEESGELDLTGIDDDEIDAYILSDDAAKKKTMFWIQANTIYLKEQKGTYLTLHFQ